MLMGDLDRNLTMLKELKYGLGFCLLRRVPAFKADIILTSRAMVDFLLLACGL